MKNKWSRSKKIRWFFYKITCYMYDGLGLCIDEKEQDEFYDKFHEYDVFY